MKKILAAILLVFGLLTLFLSSSIIFDWFEIRKKEGNFVWIVVWANFVASFLYLLSSYGFYRSLKWTSTVLTISFLILTAGLVGLFVHIDAGGIYEKKTVGAMFFRSSITLVIAILAYFTINKKRK